MTPSPALDTALAYHRAWSGGDMDAAMAFVHPAIACDTPGGRLDGADAFRAFMGPFAASVTRTHVLGAFGDERRALVMYDTDTALVAGAPGAELVDVDGGRITAMRIVFDRLPFARARAAQA